MSSPPRVCGYMEWGRESQRSLGGHRPGPWIGVRNLPWELWSVPAGGQRLQDTISPEKAV